MTFFDRMNGVASLLDETATAKVELLWQELAVRCGLVGVKTTPFPHISWQVAEAYDFPRLEGVLSSISRLAQSFTLHTTGLGLFTGENPVLYIPIIKEKTLMRFHALLWDQLNEIAFRLSLYYSPIQWIPHITLAYNDVNRLNLDCAMQTLVCQSFNWEIHIDNLVSIVQVANDQPDTVRYLFGV